MHTATVPGEPEALGVGPRARSVLVARHRLAARLHDSLRDLHACPVVCGCSCGEMLGLKVLGGAAECRARAEQKMAGAYLRDHVNRREHAQLLRDRERIGDPQELDQRVERPREYEQVPCNLAALLVQYGDGFGLCREVGDQARRVGHGAKAHSPARHTASVAVDRRRTDCAARAEKVAADARQHARLADADQASQVEQQHRPHHQVLEEMDRHLWPESVGCQRVRDGPHDGHHQVEAAGHPQGQSASVLHCPVGHVGLAPPHGPSTNGHDDRHRAVDGLGRQGQPAEPHCRGRWRGEHGERHGEAERRVLAEPQVVLDLGEAGQQPPGLGVCEGRFSKAALQTDVAAPPLRDTLGAGSRRRGLQAAQAAQAGMGRWRCSGGQRACEEVPGILHEFCKGLD
mmetsp:Transcript_70702/g.187936  ORF Transcript_70702/g.187936 Transcript_70702/m.187936 type:complete len:401 (+) Transcript_70702:60-1262(+)